MPLAPLTPTAGQAALDRLCEDLLGLRADILRDALQMEAGLEGVDPAYRDSARNLLHYLGLRRHELRGLQKRLAEQGLSSLGRAESQVLPTLNAVLRLLARLTGAEATDAADGTSTEVAFGDGERRLREHAEALLGSAEPGREVHIMVTLPSEAAQDAALVLELVRGGMNCARINCAHDDQATWAAMIAHVRAASTALGRACRIFMDLGGPKLRTGALPPELAVLKLKPQRDRLGRVVEPAHLWLVPAGQPLAPGLAPDRCLPVPARWLARLRTGERLRLHDARAARRDLLVVGVEARGCLVALHKTAYLIPGTRLERVDTAPTEKGRAARVADFAGGQGSLWLQEGDTLLLTRDEPPNTRTRGRRKPEPPRIGCTIPEVFNDVRAGEPIWFDDGRIGGRIESIDAEGLHVRITHTGPGGARLRPDKGINLPESHLHLGALTEADLRDLDFVAAHADAVELSFANCAADVLRLQQELRQRGPRNPAIVLKIETRRGFRNLPEMLLAAMRWPCCGVMVARGDLAVECGFERLAEVQEEILWTCEAAHVPAIWATQVLESLAKTGLPSRAEISDAAMGNRAECVMLNKGPQVLAALRALDDILRRMCGHQTKKRSMLRELKLAHALTRSDEL